MPVPVIIGAGLAGLSAALALAPRPVVVIGRRLDSSLTSSEMAQGGIAAAVGIDDTIRLHEQDTLAAGAGLCDPRIVKMIIESGPKAIERLTIWGVVYDKDKYGHLKLGLEGAHSRRRIVHSNGDATGASIMKAVLARVKATPSITIIDDAEVTSIETDDAGVSGVTFVRGTARSGHRLSTNTVILATGSACALWRHTTVPLGSWGHGLLLAAQAGARLRDLEFVQFHPTALDLGGDPTPLISEALRGEGAQLVNDKGDNFVGELNPRDVVARAIWEQIEKGNKVYLDASKVPDLRKRFPTIVEACFKGGVHPQEHKIPIRPVAHYHMGGIATDLNGRTNVQGLYACGEVACTGLHGANRLASNSLLEAVVMGARVADHLRSSLSLTDKPVIKALDNVDCTQDSPEMIAKVRSITMTGVGVIRTEKGLSDAIGALENTETPCQRATVSLMIAKAALARTESRGAHERKDFPQKDESQAQSRYVSLREGKIVLEDETK